MSLQADHDSNHVPHLSRKAAEEGIPELHKSEGEILVEEILEELAHAQVGPAAVHQQEALKVTELCEGVVAGEDGLHAFLTADADTNVSSWRSQRTVEGWGAGTCFQLFGSEIDFCSSCLRRMN